MRFAALTLALLGTALAPAAAGAQDPPPSLSVDTVFALPGVTTLDYRPDLSLDDAHGAAVDPELGRFYAVGQTETTAGDTDIAIVARRGDGSLDTSFDGDGRRTVSITTDRDDYAVSIAVLPDHSLRILGATDVSPAAQHDVALVGLLPDGSIDPGFGTAGVTRFSVGLDDEPAALAVGPDGRMAITGSTADGTGERTFVAVRGVTGGPSGFGAQSVDAGDLTEDDRGVAVAWGPAGPISLIAIDGALGGRAIVHAIDESDPSVTVSTTNTSPGLGLDGPVTPQAMLLHNGTLWATGSIATNGDSDAWLAKLGNDGTVLESRRFDIRGSSFASSQPVNTKALSLTLVPGDPDTLVVGGSTATDRGEDWSFAAFNGLSGPVSGLRSSELIVPVDGVGAAESLAGAAGAVAATGTLSDFDPALGGTGDLTIGMGRVLVDAEKRCDLALELTRPIELVMRGKRPGSITFRVTNEGARACAGSVKLPAPYTYASGGGDTGRLAAGETLTRTVEIAHAGPFPPTDTLVATLVAADDAQLADNVARMRVTFAFCDLALSVARVPTFLGTEGSRSHRFTLRNVGTVPCRSATVFATAPGRRFGVVATYPVSPGRHVTDTFEVGVKRGTKSGRKAALRFLVRDLDDVRASNDGAGSDPMVVRTGDTNARKPVNGKLFRGTSKPGTARGVAKRKLKVDRVEIAIVRDGPGCQWLSSAAGTLRVVDAGPKGRCDAPVWVKTSGIKKWELKLRRALPPGRYTLFSRAVLANGVPEARFSRADHTRVSFRVR